MPMTESVKGEVLRSPITVVATVAGVVVSALSLLVAWLQYAGAPAIVGNGPTQSNTSGLHISNLLLIVASFLGTSFSCASLIRLLARHHWFAALVLSVPVAVLSCFCTLIILHLAPPKPLTREGFQGACDAVFYGTVFVFVAITGLAVLKDLAHGGDSTSKGSDGIGAILIGAIVLMVWSTLVSTGTSKLVQIFLA